MQTKQVNPLQYIIIITISPAATGGAQQSIFGGITVILYDSFDMSSWHAPSIPDQYLIKLNQAHCWWELTNTDSCRENRFGDNLGRQIQETLTARGGLVIFQV